MDDPLISIVILNYNTCRLLDNCLHSIGAYAPRAEIIVVDNASGDDSATLVRNKYPKARLIANAENLGFARGLNLGLQTATAPLILALNADTELLPHTLASLTQAAQQLPDAGILGPAQYLPHPTRPGTLGPRLASAYSDPTLAAEAWRLLFFGDAVTARLKLGPWRDVSGPPCPVDWLMGAALLFKRECLNDVQGFEESQFMYGEDWDICYRARAAGWQVYLVPAASIIHHENASGKQLFGPLRQARVLEANLHFHQKHYGRASRRALVGLYCLSNVLRLGLLGLLWPLWSIFPTLRHKWQAQRAEARLALRDLLQHA